MQQKEKGIHVVHATLVRFPLSVKFISRSAPQIQIRVDPVDTMQLREPFAANGRSAGPELVRKEYSSLSFPFFLKGLRDSREGF